MEKHLLSLSIRVWNLYTALNLLAEIEGLKRKLTSKLGASNPGVVPDWQVLSSALLYGDISCSV